VFSVKLKGVNTHSFFYTTLQFSVSIKYQNFYSPQRAVFTSTFLD